MALCVHQHNMKISANNFIPNPKYLVCAKMDCTVIATCRLITSIMNVILGNQDMKQKSPSIYVCF